MKVAKMGLYVTLAACVVVTVCAGVVAAIVAEALDGDA